MIKPNKMMKENIAWENLYRQYGKEVIQSLMKESTISEFPSDVFLVREGHFVKVVPIVIEGLIKVYSGENDKEVLLYYIQPGETCIMSFSAVLNNEKSKVLAVTKEKTTAILLPAEKISAWLLEFPILNKLFYQQYGYRYTQMIETIHHLLFDKLDKRLLDYLKEKASLSHSNAIKISHKEIAIDLGTAREVVSRLLKKLENQQLVKQHPDRIEIR